MNHKIAFMKTSIIVQLCLFCAGSAIGQPATHADPSGVKFITTDIDHFWKMYDRLPSAHSTTDSLHLLQGYIDQGSQVLLDRARESGGISAQSLLSALRRYPRYIASIRKSTQRIRRYRLRIIADFSKLKALYPAAVFPDFYFVMGDFDSGGKPVAHGMYIAAEINGGAPDAPLDEFRRVPGLRFGLSTVTQIEAICCHELIHWQQQKATRNLLWLAVREGAADFIGEQLCGRQIDGKQAVFGNAHEHRLWQRFTADTTERAIPDWLFNGSRRDLDMPPNMGYYLGYRICRAYYLRRAAKKYAIRRILQVRDARRFLAESGYHP